MEKVFQNERIKITDEKSINRIVTKNIFILILGQLVSLIGSSIYSFAMGLYILSTTGSGLYFSITIALGVIPKIIFGPISGVVADRVNRKKMIITMDLLSGIVVIALFALSSFDSLRLIYIYISTFLIATCTIFSETPMEASIPNLVDEKRLTKATSLNQAVLSISSIAGPSIGGVVFALIDIRLFLLINGLSFIFAALMDIFLDFKIKNKIHGVDQKTNQENDVKHTFFEDLKEGIAYIKSQTWLVVLGSFTVFLNMFFIIGITVTVPYVAVNVWNLPSNQLGILEAMFPLGMLIGTVITFLLPEAKSVYKRIMICIAVASIGMLFTGILTCNLIITLDTISYFTISIILFIILAICSVLYNIPFFVSLQKKVPNDMLGRVRSVILTFITGLTPVGAVIGGALVDIVSPWLLPMVCGIIMVILTIIMSRMKALKAI
ncbi:UNVERIFIED_CONTAM: MFS transporter [Lysinibacillus xylanilyticus]|uniref:MFS transporter n=1 Tax=Lysinibacillus xylanilyticus TaxID=582475 RepID=UPI00067100A2|nr:MFS transporter [Lysinibacillus xylanilyticus]